MLINGSLRCGPFPKITETTSSCCPPSGLWSDWTRYGRNDADTAWVRSRRCVSEEAGCPCVGPTTQSNSTCPCRAMIDVTSIITANTTNRVYPNNATINHATCSYTGWLVSEAGPDSRPCNSWTSKYQYASVIRFTIPSTPNERKEMRVFDCTSADIATQNKLTFYCDLGALYWRLDYDNNYVNGWGQLNIWIKPCDLLVLFSSVGIVGSTEWIERYFFKVKTDNSEIKPSKSCDKSTKSAFRTLKFDASTCLMRAYGSGERARHGGRGISKARTIKARKIKEHWRMRQVNSCLQ